MPYNFLLLKAALAGGLLAIPVGPVGLLIIQRSLSLGSLRGMASGLGAAVADAVFAFLAAYGMVALFEGNHYKHFIRPLGGVILFCVGLAFILKKSKSTETEEVLSGNYLQRYIWDALSTFLLTLTNPTTIIAFAAVFTGSDLIPEDPRKIDYLEIVLGVFLGSLSWWLILVFLARPLKNSLSPKMQTRISRVMGVILIVLSLAAMIPRFGDFASRVQKLVP